MLHKVINCLDLNRKLGSVVWNNRIANIFKLNISFDLYHQEEGRAIAYLYNL
jgi:hypothetical protein